MTDLVHYFPVDFAICFTLLCLLVDLGIVYGLVYFIKRENLKRRKNDALNMMEISPLEALIRSHMAAMARPRFFLGGDDETYTAPVKLSFDAKYATVISMCDYCGSVFNFDMTHFIGCRCDCHSPNKRKWGQILQKRPEIMQYRWTYCRLTFFVNPLDGMIVKKFSQYGFSIPIPFMKQSHALIVDTKFRDVGLWLFQSIPWFVKNLQSIVRIRIF